MSTPVCADDHRRGHFPPHHRRQERLQALGQGVPNNTSGGRREVSRGGKNLAAGRPGLSDPRSHHHSSRSDKNLVPAMGP